MGSRANHKQRIKELEGVFTAITDDEEHAEQKRYAVAAQLEENTWWANMPDEPQSFDKRRTSPAGYLPKQKPLMYRLDYHEMARQRAIEEIDISVVQRIPKKYRDYMEMLGRMKECDDWLRVQDEHGDWGTLVVGKDGQRHAKMPTFGTRTEVEHAIKNRHLGMGGMGAEEVQGHRKDVYRDIGQAHAEAIDAEPKSKT